MTARVWAFLVFGLAGVALLVSLGVWQSQRLAWKRGVLAEIEARVAAAPAPLPQAPDPAAHRFRPVVVEGRFAGATHRVVTTADGPAFRLVSPFESDGRRILVDRGTVPADAAVPPPPAGALRLTGNLHWPDEADRFTPPPDLAAGLWYARDVAAMADALAAEPLLIVAREVPGDRASPAPVGTAGIPNDHLEYALTWFSLAAIWAGMTGLLLWRMTRRSG